MARRAYTTAKRPETAAIGLQAASSDCREWLEVSVYAGEDIVQGRLLGDV